MAVGSADNLARGKWRTLGADECQVSGSIKKNQKTGKKKVKILLTLPTPLLSARLLFYPARVLVPHF